MTIKSIVDVTCKIQLMLQDYCKHIPCDKIFLYKLVLNVTSDHGCKIIGRVL